MQDESGRLWIGTHWSGVMVANATSHWQHVQTTGPLSQSRVLSLFADDQGAVWVGTLGEGLHRLTPRAVKTLQLPTEKRDYLINTVCAMRDGSVWVGTDSAGIFRLSQGIWTRFAEQDDLKGGPVYSILEDRDTNVWCGVGTQLLQYQTGRFKRMPEAALNAGLPLALYEARDGALWVATPQGPVRRQDGKTRLQSLGEGVRPVEIRSFGEDAAGNIWVGTIGRGAFCIRSNGVDHFGPQEGLTNPDARTIWCSDNGDVWIGTLGDGLFRHRNGRFEHIGAAEGLPDETINGILTDREDGVWFTTYNGLFGCGREELSFYVRGRTPGLSCRWFSLKDGLDFRTCSGAGQPVISRGVDGRMWFINQSSLAVLEPQTTTKRGRVRKLVVESLVVDGQVRKNPPAGVFRVPSRFRSLEIHYTSPDLIAPESLRFRYRLQNYEDEWVEAGERRVAYFNRLPPGSYNFEIMAGGPGEDWRQWSRNFALEIIPRFYERRSVQMGGAVGMVSLLAGTVWVTGRARLRRRLEKLEAQNAIERERHRIAQDLHDDLGTSLTEINLLSTMARRPSASREHVETRLGVIAEKSHEMVKALDEIVWAVNPKNDSLPRVVNYLCQFVQEFLEPTGIRVRLEVPPELAPLPLNSDQRHTLYLVVKEAVANVAKHSAATELWLRVHYDDDKLELSLEDNGRGFDSAQVEPGRNGLGNMRDRMAGIRGRCELRSAPGKGTTVRFQLPWQALGNLPAPKLPERGVA
jgi:signal transduction histidine kinase/streptogramin lyase